MAEWVWDAYGPPAFVEAHTAEPWDWGAHGLSGNPAITPDEPWDWGAHGLSGNPAITPAFVDAHPDWGAHGLSGNPAIRPPSGRRRTCRAAAPRPRRIDLRGHAVFHALFDAAA